MIFKDALKELNNHNRICHKDWNKIGFIFKDSWHSELYIFCLLSSFVRDVTEPQFKGEDERLYSSIGYVRIDQNDDSHNIIHKIQILLTEYFHPARFILGMFGYGITSKDPKDDWEILRTNKWNTATTEDYTTIG